jgi:hypothetical protein
VVRVKFRLGIFLELLLLKRSSSRALPGKFSKTKSSDVWIIQSGCNVCGKSQEVVEKKLKEEGII